MKTSIILTAALSLAAFATPAAAQNLVTNPGFETGDFTGWTSNWGVTTSNAISGNYSAYTGCVGGSCIRDEAGNFQTAGNGAYLYQDIATVAGATYALSFDYTPLGGAYNELAALFGGSLAFDIINPANSVQTYTTNVTATDATTRLMFLGRQDPAYLRLDNVSLVQTGTAAVPEAATWAMMIVGFGAMGGALRRRNGTTKVAFAA